VHGHLIFKRNHPQVSAAELRDRRPKSIAIVFLRLASNGVQQNKGTPFLLQVRPTAQDNAFEIGGESQFFHGIENAGAFRSGQPTNVPRLSRNVLIQLLARARAAQKDQLNADSALTRSGCNAAIEITDCDFKLVTC
jgi:hypothetical protein